jgi:hypothetical protein
MAEEKSQGLESVSLMSLESAVFKGDYISAEKIIQLIMKNQRIGKMEFRLPPAARKLNQDQTDLEAYQLLERLATLITKMLSDSSYISSQAMFKEFVLGKRFLSLLFLASSYINTDHIMRNLGLDKRTNYNKEDIRRFLILICPNSNFTLPWKMLSSHMPAEVGQSYLGLMTAMNVLLEEKTNENMNTLAALAKELPLMSYKHPENLNLIMAAYFGVSNLTGKDKYELKKWTVKNIEYFMDGFLSKKVKARIKKGITKKISEKRTVLIIHERYTSTHAMHRCYHGLIAGLKDEFHVIGMAYKDAIDNQAKEDHHEFIEFVDINDIESVINDILDIKPDMILYPSLGMSLYGPLLATQRLAPIQCLCPGHPSSSHSANIDYMLYGYIGLDKALIQSHFNEKVIEMNGLPPMACNDFVIEPFNKDDTFKVCVNGVMPKVSFELIEVCQQITLGTDKEVEFQFFLGSSKLDLEYYAGMSALRRHLPNAKIHHYSDYNAYMNVLAQCHFAIPTFPFGGSNSNMDCLRAILPKLYLTDDRVFVGYTDYQIWNNFGLMEGLCDSKDDLIKRAILYIESPIAMDEYKGAMKAISQSGALNQKSELGANNYLSEQLVKLFPS